MIVASGAGISFAGREIGAGLSANVVIRPAVDFSFRLAADIVRLRNNDSPALAAFDGYVRETMRMATARR
jgi:hypothetical protein